MAEAEERRSPGGSEASLEAFACLDFDRLKRTGMAETLYCPGKSVEQAVQIFQAFAAAGQAVLGTRATPEQAKAVAAVLPEVYYEAQSRTLRLDGAKRAVQGRVAVCTGGTADIPVAEEAAQTASFFGAEVMRAYDIGVAGLHRVLSRVEELRQADVVIAVAGMEGALAAVLAGLVEAPVIAVPTSVGYGAAFSGLTPLLAMLNTCAEGVSVVNIDNGFGAAVQACRILRLSQRRGSHGPNTLP